MRITDAVLGQDVAYSGASNVFDLKYGGQNGYMPKIGTLGPDGNPVEEWISNQAYVSKNVIAIVIRAPKFFNYMPDTQKWMDAYKALIELHPMSIGGLNSGLEVEIDEHAIGGDSSVQEEISNVTRAKSNINFVWKEKANKSIVKFLDMYIRYGMMDPNTKKPLVATFMTVDDITGMYTPDFYSGTVLFIEPDITQKTVVDAWLTTNFFPKATGERIGKRNIHAAGETIDLSIDFAGITMNNEAVLRMASNILSNLTVLSTIPDVNMITPFNAIDPDVAASAIGYNE